METEDKVWCIFSILAYREYMESGENFSTKFSTKEAIDIKNKYFEDIKDGTLTGYISNRFCVSYPRHAFNYILSYGNNNYALVCPGIEKYSNLENNSIVLNYRNNDVCFDIENRKTKEVKNVSIEELYNFIRGDIYKNALLKTDGFCKPKVPGDTVEELVRKNEKDLKELRSQIISLKDELEQISNKIEEYKDFLKRGQFFI